MPGRHKGDHKPFSTKNTMNPPTSGTEVSDQKVKAPGSGRGSQEQDAKRRIGQFGGAGEPELQKK